MATATRVTGDKECDGGKSDGNDEKGCGRATAPKREVAAATRVAGDEKGDGEGGESDGDAYEEDEGGAMVRKRARAIICHLHRTVSLLVTCSPSSSDS